MKCLYENKKLFSLITMSIFLISLMAVNSLAESPSFSVTMLSQSPDPVEPGQTVKIKFKIENEGSQTVDDVIAKIDPQYPFEIYGDETEKNLGRVSASSTNTEVSFTLKVDEDAVEGETELDFELQFSDSSSVVYDDGEFTIDIQTNDAVLDISTIEFNPEAISPGETSELSFIVKNQADSLLKDITFKLELNDDDLPFAPYLSSSEKRIDQLNSDYQSSLSFEIICSPDAEVGLYKIPINITYYDENDNAYSSEDLLAISVSEEPTLKAYIKKTEIYNPNQQGKVTIQIANSGISNVQSLEMDLINSSDYKLLSTTNYFYIGDLDADDTESEELNIYVANPASGEVNIPIKLSYSDENNNDYEEYFYLDFELYSEEELKMYGLASNGNSSYIYIIIVLAIASGGYYWYRKRKKKSEQ